MTTLIQRNFSGGEVSPAIQARADLSKYSTSLRTLRNMQIMKEGGVQSRAGGHFLFEAKYENMKTIAFMKGAQIIEIGHQYLRVYDFIDGYISGLSNSSGYSVRVRSNSSASVSVSVTAEEFTAADHGLSNGDLYTVGLMWPWSPDSAPIWSMIFSVEVLNSDSFKLKWTLGPNKGMYFDATGSGGTITSSINPIRESLTAFTSDALGSVRWIDQGASTLIFNSSAAYLLDEDGVLTTATFTPGINSPVFDEYSGGKASAESSQWTITSIKKETYEESVPNYIYTVPGGVPAPDYPSSLSWFAEPNAVEYNVYRNRGPDTPFGLVGILPTTKFIDTGVAPDYSNGPPVSEITPGDGNGFVAACIVDQRLAVGGNAGSISGDIGARFWMSKVGAFGNFTTSSPLKDGDAISARIANARSHQIRHMFQIDRMIVLTDRGEWLVSPGEGGYAPGSIQINLQSNYGSAETPPVVIGKEIIFVQNKTSSIRSLGYKYEVEGYSGNDLTVFASHLFRGHEILWLTYQNKPDSIIWCVRSDGAMVAMTYIPEHQIFGWSRHDTDGLYTCAQPADLYFTDNVLTVTKRLVGGVSRQYIEISSSREIESILDYVGTDCSSVFNGRLNNRFKITDGTTWLAGDTVTVTGEGDEPWVIPPGVRLRVKIASNQYVYMDTTSASLGGGDPQTATLVDDLPLDARDVWFDDVARVQNELTGLWHLEGREVSVLADGFVLSSPLNSDYPTLTVTNGKIELDGYYGVIVAGLPYVCDFEPLDVEPADRNTFAKTKRIVKDVGLMVEDTRGLFVGPSFPTGDDALEGLIEAKVRSDENYDEPIALTTGLIEVAIEGHWKSNGRFVARQVDPLPVTILAAIPSGVLIPGRD